MQVNHNISLSARFVALVAALGPALTCFSPRIMSVLFIGCTLIGIAAESIQKRRWPQIDIVLAVLFSAFMVWGAITYFWALSPDSTLIKLGQFAPLFAALVLLKKRIETFTADDLILIGRMLAVGTTLGVYYFDWLNPVKIYDLVRHGYSPDLFDNRQNKPVVLLALWCCLSFPYLFNSGQKWTRAYFLILAGLTAYATYYSPSNSAMSVMYVLPAMAVVFYVMPYMRGIALLAAVSMSILSFSMLPIARGIALKTDWFNDPSISYSARARFEIWDQAARRILEQPMAGWGLDSSPFLPNRGEHLASKNIPGEEPAEIAHLHPHNAPLQIWFEMGVVGLAFLPLLLLLIARGIGRMTGRVVQAFGMTLFCQIFLYTLSIWGIWQSWFMATLCFAGLMTYSGMRYLTVKPLADRA